MWGTRSTLIWERSPLMYLSIGKIEMSMFAFELCYLCSGLKTTENFEKNRIWVHEQIAVRMRRKTEIELCPA